MVCALAFVAVNACDKGDDPLTEEQFCLEYAKRECAEVGKECGFEPSVCEPIRATACRLFAASQKSAMRQYVPGNVDACLSQTSTAYKDLPITPMELQALEDVCSRVFQGTAPAAAPCEVDYDCDGTMICDKGRCGTAKQVASGAGCSNLGERCPQGESCTKTNDFYMCTKRREKGMTCSATEPCLERYRCIGTCVDKLPLSSGCFEHSDCVSDYCSPYGNVCGQYLNFAYDSASCRAFMATSVPTSDAGDAGADSGP